MVYVIHSDKEFKNAQEAGLVKKTQIKKIVDEETITSTDISRMPKTSEAETLKMVSEQMDKMQGNSNDKQTREAYNKLYKGIRHG